MKKAASIIASNSLAFVGSTAGWGLGTYLGGLLSIYMGFNPIVATGVIRAAGAIGFVAAGTSAKMIYDKIASCVIDERALE